MIGNYVRVKGDCEHKPFTVGGIKKDGNLWLVYLEEADTWYEPKSLEPIEITAEMLIANGFGGENPDDYYGEEMELQLDFSGWPYEEQEEGWSWNSLAGGYGTQIKYVHQLQNALTNCGRHIDFKLDS